MSNSGPPLAEVLESVRPGAWGSDVATEERPIPVRVVRNGDISEDRRILADNIPRRWVSEKELQNSRVTDRDTLLVGSGYIGKSARLGDLRFEEPVIASNFIRIVSPDGQTNPSWLFWLLGLDSATNYMQRISAGTSLKNLPTSFFREWKIPYHPPLKKQRHIASVLDSVEGIVEQIENVINKTEQLSYTLLHKLLTRGLPGHHRKWKEVPSLGTIPASWQAVRLGDVSEIVMGQSPPGHTVFDRESINTGEEGLPFIQGNAEFGELYPTPIKWCVNPPKIANPGAILISVRAPVGEMNRVLTNEMSIGRGLAAIYFPEQDRDYGWYAINKAKNHLGRISQGSTFGAISYKDLVTLKIPYPVSAERNIIAFNLNKVEIAIRKIKKELYFATIFKGAIQHSLLMSI